MNIEEALTTYLLAQTGLTALIDRRLHPDLLPQNANYPAVVWINVSDVKNHVLSGQLAFSSPMIQYTAYGTSRKQSKEIADQLKIALSDFFGTLSGIVVDYIRLENEITSISKNQDGTVEHHTTDLEYEVNYQET